ncbi:MAG: TonB-linked SusC/RagA family outer membrane protein, partial [Flavobacteriaceae bacterium]
MKVSFLSLCLLLGTMFSNIQSQSISGNVKDANSIPIAGVNISVDNSNNGAVTDYDGNFSISNVSSDSNLIFSYLGYQPYSVTVGIQTDISVVMQEDLSELDEIVVIGYGSQKLSDISGAVSTVSSSAIEAIKPVRIEDALQGQASGINIISSGSPGSKPTVLIRGITSYAGNSPLVVIDGVSQSIDDLNSLNPSDIKSVNVLKDAALASIYGVKGGSGVIVVTTKSGERNSETSFNFSTSVGNQSVVKMIDVLNASEYAGILNEASMAAGEGLIYPNLSGIGKGTNWQEQIINDAAIVNHSITASGGSDKTSFYVSAGYLGQDGVVGPSDKSFFNRTNFTSNINTDLTKKTKLIINTNYTNIKGKGLPENGINSVLSNSLNFDPTVNPYENGSFGTSETITQEIINPLAQIDNTYNEGNTNKLTGKIELQHNLLDNLKVTSRFGYTFVDIYNKNFIPLAFYGAGHNATNANEDLSPIVSVDAEGTIVSTHNRISESKTNYFNYTFETYANYDFTIQEDHNFQTVLGFSIGENKGENISAYNEDVPFNSWAYADISAATGNATQQTSGSWQYVGRNVSYFSRLLYDFDQKYYFSFTGRVDGSTSFGANNKFGFFPSASLGWVISKEDFFEDAPLDYLKFRASYGSLGNDNINPQFALISTFPSYTFDGSIINGSALGSVPNEAVSWENQVQMNFGIDTRLFDNKLSVTVDYFKKTVDDLLFSPNLSLYLGTPSFPTTNIGKTQSTGIDASLSYNTTIGKDFNISTNVNFTTSDNEVLAINNGDKFIWGAGYGIPYTPIVRFEEGYSP